MSAKRMSMKFLFVALLAAMLLGLPHKVAAHGWTSPTNISNDANESIYARIAVTPDGTTHVVWLDATNLKVMYAAEAAGGGWSAPAVVATFTIVDLWGIGYMRPAIAGGPDNSVHLLFLDDSTGNREVYYMIKPAGGSWSAPVNISNSPGTRSEYPDMTVAGDGTIHAVFNDGAPTSQMLYHDIFYVRKPPGGAWSSPLNVSNRPSANDFEARVALAPNGSLHVVWHDPPDAWYATSPDGISWSAPATIASAGDSVWPGPRVAVDTGGNVHVAYAASPEPLDIYHIQKPPSGSWSSPENVSNTGGDSGWQDMRADSSGALHLIWHDNTGGNYDVMYAYKPSGGPWSAPTNLSSNAGTSICASLAVTPNGSLHVVWQDDTPGNTDIFYAASEPTLVAEWKLDEGSGTVAYDSSGNGNNGTLINGPTWVDGRLGKALRFDGTDDFVSVNDSETISSPSATRAITVAAWVKPDPGLLDRYARVVVSHWYDGQGSPSACAWALEGREDTRYHAVLTARCGGDVIDLPSTTAVQEGVWQHLAFTWDGSTVTFYFNGQVDATAAYTGNMSDSPRPLQIGKTDQLTYVWKGLIDEVSLYNRALSPDEIQFLMQTPPPSVGGVAELLPPASASEEAGVSTDGSGWSAGGYAALAGGLAGALVAITAGAWYARRRRRTS